MRNRLQQFCAFLHPIIARTSVPRGNNPKLPPVLSPRQLLEFCIANPTPIDAALYSLSTGKVDFNTEKALAKDFPDVQSLFLTAIESSDILLRHLHTRPTYFQLMFGEQLARNHVSKQFKDICSAFRLAPSRNFSLRNYSKEVIKSITEGADLRPRDFVLLLFDNIGFKMLGKNASYNAWTLVQVIIIKEADLIKESHWQRFHQLQKRPSNNVIVELQCPHLPMQVKSKSYSRLPRS